MGARRWSQVISALAINPYFQYFSSRSIYQGGAKHLCAPVLNCWSCPLAVFSCPIGGLQRSFASFSLKTREFVAGLGALLYVMGTVGLIGAVFGRMPCGWVCPFGLLQDMLYKLPFPKLKLPRWISRGRYLFLGGLVVLAPLLTARSWFSRLCPAGALEGGVFLKAVPPQIKMGTESVNALPPAGWFFWLKVGILLVFLLWMMASKRPFCRAVCPLGALLGMGNRLSFYRMAVDDERCNSCGRCLRVCPVDMDITRDPNSPDCIRCLECKKGCPRGAIRSGFARPQEGLRTAKAGLVEGDSL